MMFDDKGKYEKKYLFLVFRKIKLGKYDLDE